MGKFLCIHLQRHSQNIRSSDGSGYIDTYYYCSELKKRISKKHCIGCNFYKPLIKNEKSI